jgi:CBS domain-containing protein
MGGDYRATGTKAAAPEGPTSPQGEPPVNQHQICDVMTRDVRTVSPDDSVEHAAQCMDQLNVGAVPVVDGDKLVGMVTDRDITVRAVAAGKPADRTPVSEVMSTNVRWCYEDQDVDDVLDEMRDTQIRRVPVLSRDELRLIGIVSLGDLAERGGSNEPRVAETLRDISTPSQPDRH